MNAFLQAPLGQFEEELLTELKEFVVAQPAIGPHRSRAPRHRRVLTGAAVGACAAVAAGLLIATAAGPAHAPVSGYTLDAFLTAAASAAREQHTPLPRPDQAFYEKNFSLFPWAKKGECTVMWSLHPLTGDGEPLGVASLDGSSRPCSNYLSALPVLVALSNSGRFGFSKVHLYPALNSLPVSPAPLRSALYAATAHGPAYWGLPKAYTRDEVVFTMAGRLLEGPISGSLRAAVYEVIAGLPRVRLIQHATDALGRHGVGIEMHGLPPRLPDGLPWTGELVIAPRSYRFLGMNSTNGSKRAAFATIGTGLVPLPKPGHVRHSGAVGIYRR
jgi:hypothetical protein